MMVTMSATTSAVHVEHVVGIGAGSKMGWLDTDGSITGVKDKQPWWDRSDEDLVGSPMSEHLGLFTVFFDIGKKSIPLGLGAFDPVPAPLCWGWCGRRLSGHVFGEELLDTSSTTFAQGQRISIAFPHGVMSATPSSGRDFLIADAAPHGIIVAKRGDDVVF